MRKFLPRFFNVISFLLALLMFFPWISINEGLTSLASKTGANIFDVIGQFFSIENSGLRLYAIPIVLVLISIIYLITALIDRNIIKHNKTTARPIENTIYAPLVYMGIASALSGFIYFLMAVIFQKDNPEAFGLVVQPYDYFGLGGLLLKIPAVRNFGFSPIIGLVVFLVLLILQTVFSITLPYSTRKRGFPAKFFTWILFLILSFISMKGMTLLYGKCPTTIKEIVESINITKESSNILFETRAYASGFDVFVYLGVALLSLILYIVIGINVCHRYNKASRTAKAMQKRMITDEILNIDEKQEPVHMSEDDEIFDNERLEDEEEVPQSQEVEHVQIYEESDLDKVFGYDFNFDDVEMTKDNGTVSYYVKKIKFLTLSNDNKTMQFRLELDKAIRLVIEYPMIQKDRYENHKIWFRLENVNALPIESRQSIVRQAYMAVVNNL